ncbi:hypothetical protein FA15DRAFT_670918 [Coprinopsis marcescibilis]|uniref:Nephrocystin 3-like N-terminal domain-containing protein n=1 Tax=Coprinopsis marcescibilis TaxID=230819 RepID=A0A5C3KRL6_COPMA|nr:hypothetical protein FA15DRAFT_670918 [Coprinopsis marcescibilis]
MEKLRISVKKWKEARYKDEDPAARSARLTRVAAQAFAGASNFQLQDVQVNVAGGDIVNNNSNVTHVHNYASITAEMHEAFRRLADPKGCTWDPSRTCLPGTRLAHIEETSSWINAPIEDSGSAETFLVAQGAGSGKSALAHSVCQRADVERRLLASFFFSQMNAQHSTVSNLMAAIIRGLCSIGEDIKERVGKILIEDSSLASATPELQFTKIILPVCTALPPDRPYVVVIDALDELRDVSLLKLLRDSIPRLPPSFRIFLTTRPEQRIMMYLEKQRNVRQSSFPMTGELSRQDLEVYIRHRLSETDYGPDIPQKLLESFVYKTEGVFLWAATVLNHLDEAFDPVEELQDIVASKSDHWKESPDATKQLDDIYERILSQMKWTDTKFTRIYQIVVGALVTLMAPLSPTALASLYAPEGVSISDISRLCVILRPLLHHYDSKDNTQPLRLLHLSVQQYLTERAPSPYRIDCSSHHVKLSKHTLLTIKKDLNPQNVPILGYSISSDAEDSLSPESSGTKVPELSKQSMPEHIWYASRFFDDHLLESPADQMDKSHVQLIHDLLLNPRPILEVTASMGFVVDLGSIRDWVTKLSFSAPPLPMRAAQSLYGVANCLQAVWRSREAWSTSKEAIVICRTFVDKDPDLYVRSRLVLSMCIMSQALLYLWPPQFETSLEISREGLDIVRMLIQENPTRFQHILVRLLISHASSLRGLHRIDEALQTSLEAVDVCRKFASTDQRRYAPHLADALQNLGFELRTAMRYEETLPVSREEIALRRQILADDTTGSSRIINDLAWSLTKYGAYLTVAGHKEEALVPLKEATELYRQLAATSFKEHGRHLSSSLAKYACNLSACQKYEEATVVTSEAIELLRQGHGDDAWDPLLLTPLWTCASSLTKLERNEEAISPAMEGLAISRNLFEYNSGYQFAVAWSLNILTFAYNACKQYNEAAPLGKEAVELYRELAEKNPAPYERSLGDSEALHDRFYPSDSDLANSLYTYSVSLAGMGERDAALKEAKEAIVVLQRMSERFPERFQAKLADAVKLVDELEALEH